MENGVVLGNVQNTIQRYSSNTLSALVQLDHTSDLLHSPAYSEGVKMLSSYLANTVMAKKSADFHQNLNWIEKKGFLSESKRIAFEESAQRAGQQTVLVANIALNSVPYIASLISSNRDKKNIQDFFISWMGYLNKDSEITPLMIHNTQSLLQAASIRITQEKIRAEMQMSQSQSGSRKHLNKNNRSILNKAEESNLLSIMNIMLSSADLERSEVKDRALELINEVFMLPYDEASKKLEDIMAAQEHLSQFLEFSSFSYLTFFNGFIYSFEEAQRIGVYDVNLDVYAQKRLENRGKIINITKKAAQMVVSAGVSYVTGNPMPLLSSVVPTKDIVQLSEGLMSSTLNPNVSPEVGMEIMKKIAEQRRAFNG